MPSQQALQEQRSQRLAALLQHYQLERDPFSDAGMRGLFFAGGDRKNVVDALLHFSRYGTAPLFLSAPAGFGKTTILNEFALRVEQDINCAVITVDMLLSPAQLYQNILHGFAVAAPAEGIQGFSDWLGEQATRNRQVVLCLDDAQNLDREFVQSLVELAGNSELAFKLVFAGRPDARLMLENAVEQNGMLFNSIELSELSQAQVSEYVQYRLAAVGYRGEFPLTAMQVQAAALRSRGSIAQLNEMVRDLLIAGLDSGRARSGSIFPRANLLIAGLLAGVTLYFGWRSLEVEAPIANPPITLEKAQQLSAATAVKMPQSVDAAQAGEGQPGSGGQAGVAARVPANVAIARAAEVSAGVAQTVPVAAAGAPPAEAAEDVPDSAREQLVRPAKLSNEPRIEPAVESRAAPAVSQASAGASDQSPSQRVYQRLQAWPDEGYALQVFGTHNEQRAKKLVEQYFGEADLLFYETRHNGKPWFVVINGPYSGRQSAKESIVSLPESLRRLRPWPRNIASIKGDISRFGELLGVAR